MIKTKTLFVLVTLSILWGSSFLAIKMVIDVIPPLFAFGIRFIISGLVLLIAYTFERKKSKFKNQVTTKWKDALILGGLIILGGQGLLVWGAQYLSTGMTALLNSTIPLWVAIITSIVFKQCLSKTIILGLILGFSGLIILINPFYGNNNLSPIGIISLTVSSVSWAVGSIYSSKIDLSISIFKSSGTWLIIGGFMLIITSFAAGELINLQISKISINVIVAFLYLIFLCTAVGYAEFFWLLRVETPSIANSFAYIVPVIAVFLGWLTLNEKISIQTVIATSIIIIGVILMVKSSSGISDNSKLKLNQNKNR
ncbi:MAG: DMT family transporter [Candidatus Nitrosocosmicus sp.]